MSTAKRVLQFLDEEGELPESDGEDVVGCCIGFSTKHGKKDADTAAAAADDEDSDEHKYMEMLPRRAADIFGPLPLYLMDFQGFEGLNNEFIVKEMAILERDDRHCVTTHHYFFKSPYPDMLLKTSELLDNNALQRAKHGLRWSGNGAGQRHLPYSELRQIVCGTVGRWLHENNNSIKIFVYGYEKITLLNTMLQLDDRENVEYVDLSSPYLFHEMPNLDTLMKNATGVYCPEHFLLNFVETLRMKLAGDKGTLDTQPFCALNVVNVSHNWIMQTLFKDQYFCRNLFMAIKKEM